MNAAKFTLTSTVLAAALALGLAAAPAMANPPDVDGCHNHKDCPPGGGGDGGTPTIVPTEVQWGGGIFGATEPRPCVAQMVHAKGNNGSYACQLDPPSPANQVTYNLGVGAQTARNGDADLCDVFNGVDLTPNSRYTYTWFDNCGDGSCTMNILNWFLGEEVIAATGGKADFARLVAWAEATGPFSDPNPFVDDQTLEVDEITIEFTANGSHKKIALCEYSPDLGNLIVGDVTFHSANTTP